MGSNENIASADFLYDRNGKVWVDTSGIDWAPHDDGEKYDSGFLRAEKINNVASVLKKRGNFLTTEGVFLEITYSRDYCKSCERGIGKAIKDRKRHYVKDNGYFISATKNNKRKYSDWVRAYNRLLSCLEEGVELYSPKELQLDLDDINDYVNGIDNKRGYELSDVDKGVIVSAISAGDRNGVLTADSSLITMFSMGVRKFKLKDCFISNSMNRVSYPVL